MATPFIGEVKIVAFNFPPKGWAACNGQLLPINQNQALFSLFGTTYGGDGRTETAHTLNINELPAHNHFVTASSVAADTSNPVGNYWADASKNNFNSAQNTTMAPQTIGNTGGSQPHDNMSPYLVLNFIVALQGIFPSQT